MLKKLLKYDFKSIWRVWWILAVSIFGAVIVGAFGGRIFFDGVTGAGKYSSIISMVSIIAFSLSIYAAIALPIISAILCLVRFYRNLFTDEGYLTFTLPAKRSTIFLSKVLNTLIWDGLSLAALLVFMCVYFLITPSPEEVDFFSVTLVQGSTGIINPVIFRAIGSFFADMWQTAGAWTVLYVIQFIIIVAVGMVSGTCMLYFCITFASMIAKKAKIIAGLGISYGVSSAMTFATGILAVIFVPMLVSGIGAYGLRIEDGMEALTVAVILFLIIAVSAIPTIIFYLWSLKLIEKKLNLA